MIKNKIDNISMTIGSVIVTYNRLEKLKMALKAYDKQTYAPKYLIVVNNNSTDGTKEYLEKWKKEKSKFEKVVVHLKENTGGSGGFYEGLKRSLNMNADFVWVADDDAYPDKNAFKIANMKYEKYALKDISAICGQVITEGSTDIEHRRYSEKTLVKVKQIPIPLDKYNDEMFELDQFSYVGTFLSVDKMKKVGLPNKDYFIYFDDTEHSIRMSRVGKIICFPEIKIKHDTPLNINPTISWKSYYGIRNKLYSYKKLYPLRYYMCIYLKEMLKCNFKLLLHKNVKENKLIKAALRDAKKGKLGLHTIYKPGWKM